jgi:yecA family protein
MKTPPNPKTPLTDAEYDDLAELCDEHSPLDIDGVLGLLHAVGVGPGNLEASVWLPAIFPDIEEPSELATRCKTLVLRLYNEIVEDLSQGQHQIPPPEESELCESFAAGYTVGVVLNEDWKSHEDAWALARDIAYLADRRDLLTEEEVREIEEELAPDPKALICEELSGIVGTALEIFQSDAAPAEPPSGGKKKKKARQ